MSFPNVKDKFNYPAIFSPTDFFNYRKKMGIEPQFIPPSGLIICYNQFLLKFILSNYEVKKAVGFYGDTYLLESTHGQSGILANFGIGAPVAVMLLEEMIAFGVKEFITIGEAGGIAKDINVGDLFVCDRAVRDEGVSHHYLPDEKFSYASEDLTERIKASLEKNELSYKVGASWTTDAHYRETAREVEVYQQEGIKTVEMEAAALFAVAAYRQVRMGAIFTISDLLSNLEWKPEFHQSDANWDKLFRSALGVFEN